MKVLLNIVLITYEQAEAIYDLGLFLLKDDAHDIGRTVYFNRPHYYHGKLEKDHPSPYHHWMWGTGLMFLGQLLGTIATIKDMHEAMQDDNNNTNPQLPEKV